MTFKLVDTVDEVFHHGLEPELEMEKWPDHIQRLGERSTGNESAPAEVGIREPVMGSPTKEA